MLVFSVILFLQFLCVVSRDDLDILRCTIGHDSLFDFVIVCGISGLLTEHLGVFQFLVL